MGEIFLQISSTVEPRGRNNAMLYVERGYNGISFTKLAALNGFPLCSRKRNILTHVSAKSIAHPEDRLVHCVLTGQRFWMVFWDLTNPNSILVKQVGRKLYSWRNNDRGCLCLNPQRITALWKKPAIIFSYTVCVDVLNGRRAPKNRNTQRLRVSCRVICKVFLLGVVYPDSKVASGG